jgi:hypothetical protein
LNSNVPFGPPSPLVLLTKQHGKTTYVFAVGMRNAPARGAFEIKGLNRETEAEVLGEHRRIPITNGRFEDDFQPYDVHLYAIASE